MMYARVALLLVFVIAPMPAGCSGAAQADKEEEGRSELFRTFAKAADALKPIHSVKKKPVPGDWLDRFDEEGQTFAEYVKSDPVRPGKKRRTLYILLLGEFTAPQKKVVEATAKYMGMYFNLPVRFTEPMDLSVIPDRARRVHPSWGMRQINASYVLDEVLKPRVSKDAVALIAFTSSDLWPRAGWNFVFGMASLRERVGVWSIYRNGDPARSKESFARCLLRTIKTGTHETGHMMGMKHCILNECNMNGANHREESDRNPLWLCPECVRKIWWACRCDPVERFKKMESFCRENGLEEEAEFFKKSRERIEPIFQ